MRTQRLKHLVSVAVSNVDKKSAQGEVPVRLCNYTDVYYNDRIVEGLPMMTATATDDQIVRFGLRSGDVLLTKDSETPDDIAVPAYVEADLPDVVCGYHLALLRPHSGTDGRFLFWALASSWARDQFSASANGITRFGLRYDTFGEVRLPFPEIQQQRAISDYLERETARIDGVIDKKRRMIALLEEQTHAWSVRLVLGDLGDTKGSISPSGLYRVVPEGWIETALRHLNCRVQTGPFGSQLHADEYIEGGWPVVNPMNLVEGEIRAVESMTVSDHKRAELERHILAPGDIVFGRRGEMGRAGLADDAHRGWLCGTGSLRLRLRSKLISPTYLKLLLETPVARAYFELASIGSTMDNLNSEIVLAMPTLVPPIETQDRIVESVQARRETAKVLRQLLERQIGMLQEHRQAVITAAVTGELEIPGVAA